MASPLIVTTGGAAGAAATAGLSSAFLEQAASASRAPSATNRITFILYLKELGNFPANGTYGARASIDNA
jgi:hypothetical protein